MTIIVQVPQTQAAVKNDRSEVISRPWGTSQNSPASCTMSCLIAAPREVQLNYIKNSQTSLMWCCDTAEGFWVAAGSHESAAAAAWPGKSALIKWAAAWLLPALTPNKNSWWAEPDHGSMPRPLWGEAGAGLRLWTQPWLTSFQLRHSDIPAVTGNTEWRAPLFVCWLQVVHVFAVSKTVSPQTCQRQLPAQWLQASTHENLKISVAQLCMCRNHWLR